MQYSQGAAHTVHTTAARVGKLSAAHGTDYPRYLILQKGS